MQMICSFEFEKYIYALLMLVLQYKSFIFKVNFIRCCILLLWENYLSDHDWLSMPLLCLNLHLYMKKIVSTGMMLWRDKYQHRCTQNILQIQCQTYLVCVHFNTCNYANKQCSNLSKVFRKNENSTTNQADYYII